MISRLHGFCNALMEAGWLAAAAIIPLFFNPSSAQAFEPDKMFVLKAIAVICCAAWLLTLMDGEAKTGWSGVRSFLRLPLVMPVLALAAIYLLSSILSIVPSISWWGSYRSVQGSIAFFCYSIIFLVTVSGLRSAAQLQRLQFALVLTSLPISGYALMQALGSDFIPWGAYLGRSSGSMGNPIFLGGYLVMIIPVTAGLTLSELRKPRRDQGRVFICCCGFALLLQSAALLCTRSRGPLLGLAAATYFCLFLFLLLNRAPREHRPVYFLAAAGLGVSVIVVLIAAAFAVSGLAPRAGLACFAAVLVFIAISYIFLWRTRWGKSWLWLGWAVQTLVLLLSFAIDPGGAVQKGSRLGSPLGRVAEVSGGSVDFRKATWNTGIRFMEAGAPAILFYTVRDPYHYLRRVIGYGAESTWLAANVHATPSLVQAYAHESLDSMHNEVLDSLIAVGVAGVLVYLAIVAAGFYCAFRYLGLSFDNSGGTRYLLLSGVGSLAGVLIPCAAGVPYLAGVGVVAGLLAGIFVFAIWSGFGNPNSGSIASARQLFVLGVLGALIAHVVETGVGISVTSTRLYFYLFLALLSVLSFRDLGPEISVAKKSRPKRERWDQSPLISYVAISSFVVLAESWCFMFNTTNEQSALAIFLRVWFAGYSGGETGVRVPGALILLLLTIAGGMGLMRTKTDPAFEKRFLRKAPLCLATVWIATGMLAALFWTATEGSSPAKVSLHSEARVTLFMCGFLLLLMSAAYTLFAQERTRREFTAVRRPEALTAFFVAACVIVAIWGLTLRPAWADIARRIAGVYERTGNGAAAAQLYERASEMAPGVVSYQLSAGLARGGSSDPAEFEKASLFFQKAVELNPLDPTVYRTIGTFHVKEAEQAADPARRAEEMRTAISNFEKASRLAPDYPDAYSDLGRCYFLIGNEGEANRFYKKSLQIDPNHSRTYMLLGEMQYRQKKFEEALQSFTKAARLTRDNTEARKNIGAVLALLGRKDEAIQTYLHMLRRQPNDATLLTRLALLYFSQGDYSSGLTFARRAYDATPGTARGSLEGFIERLTAAASSQQAAGTSQ